VTVKLIGQPIWVASRRRDAPPPVKQRQTRSRTNITTAKDQHLHGFTALSNNR
jgi:hypothetical protein